MWLGFPFASKLCLLQIIDFQMSNWVVPPTIAHFSAISAPQQPEWLSPGAFENFSWYPFYSCFLQSISQHSSQKDHVKTWVRSHPSSVQKPPVPSHVTQSKSNAHTKFYKDLHGLHTSAFFLSAIASCYHACRNNEKDKETGPRWWKNSNPCLPCDNLAGSIKPTK